MIQNPAFSRRKNLTKRNQKYNPPNFHQQPQENLYKFPLEMTVMKRKKKRRKTSPKKEVMEKIRKRTHKINSPSYSMRMKMKRTKKTLR